MPIIVIADSGSTKTKWSLCENGHEILTWNTKGLNPYFLSEKELSEAFTEEVFPVIRNKNPEKIFFYGAGCSTPEKKNKIKLSFQKSLPVTIEVEHDMLAVARALFNRKQGIACILGTGSNACVYDGNDITLQVPSFGYLWGDQGSGSYLGKKFSEHYFYKKMPAEVAVAFEKVGYNTEFILSQTYGTTTPNRFLASLAPVILKLSEHPWVKEFILSCFDDFFNIISAHIHNPTQFEIGFCGSIAYHFQLFLMSACAQKGFKQPQIISDPIPGLIRYHAEN
ncbi:MAG: hypothetical protein N3F09_02445 [Bacteroidia bacterium]|nr:hypothetical protein [Bacteroidia bacterium]